MAENTIKMNVKLNVDGKNMVTEAMLDFVMRDLTEELNKAVMKQAKKAGLV